MWMEVSSRVNMRLDPYIISRIIPWVQLSDLSKGIHGKSGVRKEYMLILLGTGIVWVKNPFYATHYFDEKSVTIMARKLDAFHSGVEILKFSEESINYVVSQ